MGKLVDENLHELFLLRDCGIDQNQLNKRDKLKVSHQALGEEDHF